MKLLHPLFVSGLLAAVTLPAFGGGTWTPDPSLPNPQLHVKLYEIGRKYAEANFDVDANLVGVNAKHPPNRRRHSTIGSVEYAYGLLLTQDAADATRAQAILRRVCYAQDVNMNGPTGGAFNWVYEDEAPQDLNSAAFVGSVLGKVIALDRRKPCLNAETRAMVEAAGKLAVQAVMKRDVDPGYTNIAILSTAVAAEGAKLWSIPGAAEWADHKLGTVNQLTGDGEYTEYLSPTYYAVGVGGAYLARQFAFSDAFAAKTNTTINHFWKQIALAYHAPSCQLCGPNARSYGENMLTYTAGLKYDLFLALSGNYPMPDTDTDHDWDKAGLLLSDLPIEPRPEFKEQAPAWRQWTAAMPNNAPPRKLAQFRDGNFMLGTVALQDEWKQKRNLTAYWRTDDRTAPDGFRVGFCLDETNESLPGSFPPAKMHFYCTQAKGAAVVAQMTPLNPPSGDSATQLVFAPTAKLASAPDESPLRVQDGAITTYVFPISNAKPKYTTKTDPHTFRLLRSWSTADNVGSAMHMNAYVIVFRGADQPAPQVSDLKIQGDDDSGSATAKVDGEELSVSFKKND